MKKSLLFFAVAVIAIACNEKKDEATATGSTLPAAAPSLSLPVSYSTSFTMGNPKYVEMVVQGSWKDWQDNKMDNMKSWLADTVLAIQSDNVVAKGIDSLSAQWKRGRSKYTSIVDSIDAAIAVTSTDKKEDWVLVWATEMSVKADGTKDTVAVMETWRINKDGKADMLLQFDRHARKK